MCACVWDCVDVNAGAYRGQKRALDSFRLVLQMVVSCLMWMGTVLKSLQENHVPSLNPEPSLASAHLTSDQDIRNMNWGANQLTNKQCWQHRTSICGRVAPCTKISSSLNKNPNLKPGMLGLVREMLLHVGCRQEISRWNPKHHRNLFLQIDKWDYGN